MTEAIPHPHAHIAHLAMVARLLGREPPDFRRCRVLEIGCGGGDNILPMALAYPDSRFVGIDESAVAIARGRRDADTVGAENLGLHAVGAADWTGDGPFDYILCPAVLSWVPPPEAEAILALISRSLSAGGLALVGYNTLPGWHMAAGLRDLLAYHGADSVDAARAVLGFVHRSLGEHRTAWAEAIDAALALSDADLARDHLGGDNHAFYFHRFVEAAGRHGLAYLADAEFGGMFLGNYPDEVAEALAADDVVRIEQRLDFINNRRFRSSILCRPGGRLDRSIDAGRTLDFHLRALMTADRGDADEMVFKGTVNRDLVFTARGRAACGLFVTLCRHSGRAVAAADLLAQAAATGLPEAELRTAFLDLVPRIALARGVELSLDPGAFTTEVSERPRATTLARHQARQSDLVTNARHERVGLDVVARAVLPQLDGRRDRAGIEALVLAQLKDGRLSALRDGAPITDEEQLRAMAAEATAAALAALARLALLEG